MAPIKQNVLSQEISSRRIAPIWLTAIGQILFKYKKKTRRSKQVNKILLFKLGAIGDTLLTTPLVHSLRQRYPKATIDYAIGAWASPALFNNPDISHVIPFADEIIINKQIKRLLLLINKLRQNQYDVVFILDRAWQAGVLGALIGGHTIGFDRFNEGFALNHAISYGTEPHNQAPHDIDAYLALGQSVGCTAYNKSMVLKLANKDKQYATQQFQRIPANSLKVSLCPGGASNPYQQMPSRRWSLKQYVELTDSLLQHKATVFFLGSKQDNIVVQTILAKLTAKQADSQTINYAGQTTLQEAAAIIANTDIAVMHDSALMHVASAVGTPTIALFGPTNPERKKPIGKKHRIIWKNKCSPDPNQATRPCYWENRILHNNSFECAPSMSVSDILNIIKKVNT